jgi:hypothetical protein
MPARAADNFCQNMCKSACSWQSALSGGIKTARHNFRHKVFIFYAGKYRKSRSFLRILRHPEDRANHTSSAPKKLCREARAA